MKALVIVCWVMLSYILVVCVLAYTPLWDMLSHGTKGVILLFVFICAFGVTGGGLLWFADDARR